MRLKQSELRITSEWEEKGFELPKFNRDKMIEQTLKNPEWIHFGAGNIFRAFPAAVCQELLNKGILKSGIIVAEGFDYEIIEKSYRTYDNLSLLVTLKPDGNLAKKVVGSVAESLCMDTENKTDWNRLTKIFKNPGLKIVSFTITEKGYSLKNDKQEFIPSVLEDFKHDPAQAVSYIGKLTALLYERYLADRLPLTLVSMDNCSHNGTRLFEAVTTFADKWVENGMVEEGFNNYVRENISYPWSMIDKITPRPSESVIHMLEAVGFEDTSVVITAKNTYVAPFVNAEEPQYLVIEDNFKNGRLPLEQGGIIFTNKEIVDKVEKMKVCTCLNPLHTSLAIFGCLLSYDKISDEMKDKELSALINKIGYVEGMPVVSNPGIINPEAFLKEVLSVRFPNPFMPDTPQRIACDTSQKLAIRFGETMKAYIENEHLNVENLTFIPLVLAGWLRYLCGIDDQGKPFTYSPDPMLSDLTPVMEQIKLGDKEGIHEIVKGILSNKSIFGIDLYEAGLGYKVESFFTELIQGPGAVRNTLKKYLD
ncbi:mannitol dehydrogenase family protein [Anaerocolumna sp. MB42-C2]|uniref:mannitol dehydrogenase family protein n=1 Tax=Anaerocolumna sp. MB42-C2 TaxID=3070997 RepID=UPI0027DFED66|nr:mannitol dehydrogenase family protein [Anaerocolumna sp. MB42-C2]WMJ87864.1 mannitol dehydrogenase family protein [Anaerocolumna sp. MB42-C2]